MIGVVKAILNTKKIRATVTNLRPPKKWDSISMVDKTLCRATANNNNLTGARGHLLNLLVTISDKLLETDF
jgi:hypothetical protein